MQILKILYLDDKGDIYKTHCQTRLSNESLMGCMHLLENNYGIHVHKVASVQFFATLWTVALRAPLSIAFSRQEYWSGLPCPPPGYLFNPGIEPVSAALQSDSLPLSHQGNPGILLT